MPPDNRSQATDDLQQNWQLDVNSTVMSTEPTRIEVLTGWYVTGLAQDRHKHDIEQSTIILGSVGAILLGGGGIIFATTRLADGLTGEFVAYIAGSVAVIVSLSIMFGIRLVRSFVKLAETERGFAACRDKLKKTL